MQSVQGVYGRKETFNVVHSCGAFHLQKNIQQDAV